mgnify:CR=1 FL=1
MIAVWKNLIIIAFGWIHVSFLKIKLYLIITLFSGLPMNAKVVSTLLDTNKIDIKEANKLLSFSFFPSIMFVIGTVGNKFLNNNKIALYILLIIYISNFIVFLFNYKKLKDIDFNISNENKSFSNLIKESIINSVSTLLVILGTIVIFNLICSIINYYLNISDIPLSIINSILEMTSGIKRISLLNINNENRTKIKQHLLIKQL